MLRLLRSLTAARALLLVGAMLSLAACDGGSRAGEAVERDSAGVRIVAYGRFPDALDDAWRLDEAPALTLGSSAEASAPPLFRVTALRRLADGRIAVANSGTHQIILLTSTGAVSAVHGREGDGPGEYRGIGGLWVPSPDTLVVYDGGGRITTLDGAGHVLHTAPVVVDGEDGAPIVRGRFPSGDYLVYLVRGYGAQARAGVSPDSVTFGRYRPADGAFQRLGRLQAGVSYVRNDGATMRVTGLPFAPIGVVAARGDGFWTASGDRFVVDAHDARGRRVLSVRAEAAPAAVEERHREREAAAIAEGDDPSARQAARRLLDEMPVPTTFPLLDRMLVDADGNVWVREYLVDRDQPARWRVFSPEGRYLSRVMTPAGFQVMEIGRDHVLGVARDEMDEESVRMYALRKGDGATS